MMDLIAYMEQARVEHVRELREDVQVCVEDVCMCVCVCVEKTHVWQSRVEIEGYSGMQLLRKTRSKFSKLIAAQTLAFFTGGIIQRAQQLPACLTRYGMHLECKKSSAIVAYSAAVSIYPS